MEVEVLKGVAERSNSEVTLFFIAMCAFLIILIVLYFKDRHAREKQNSERDAERVKAENDRYTLYSEREARIIAVITANTEVMSGVKTTLDVTMDSLKAILETTRSTNKESFERVHTRIDQQCTICTENRAQLQRVASQLEDIARDLKSESQRNTPDLK